MAIHPRIYVGLGSTGAKIVSRLKKELEGRADKRTLEWTYFLAITSEKDRESGVSNDLDFLSLSLGGVGKTTDVINNMVLNERQDRDIIKETSNWWYWENQEEKQPWYPPLDSFTTGCGGIRACGRMLFHATAQVQSKLKGIQDYFQEKYTSLLAKDEEEAAEISIDEKICRMFGLLAGGTCSGLFLDIPFLIKEILGHSTTIAGTYLLGDVCHPEKSDATRNRVRQHTQDYNTAFALAELSVLQSRNGRSAILKEGNWPRTLGLNGRLRKERFDTMAPPYYRVTLVGARSQLDLPLEGFDSYVDFLGNYYTRLLLANADIGQARGDVVDEQANNAQQADEQYRDRPNTIELIGMLNVKMPTKKLRAIAAEQVITHLSTDDFYNNDPERYQSCKNLIENKLGWTGFYGQFAAPDDDCIRSADRYALPDSADAFEKEWRDAEEAINDYYGRCTRLEQPEVAAAISDVRSRAASVLTEVLQDLLGGIPDKGLEMGSLKYLLNDLLGADEDKGVLTSRLDDCQNRIAATREELYGAGGAQQTFEEALARQKTDFPSRFNPLRSRWAGAASVRSALIRYRDALRDLAKLTAAEVALRDLVEQVRRVSVVRKLIAKYAAYTVFDGYRKEVEKLLDDNGVHDFTNRDVISNKAELLRLAESILKTVPAGRGGTDPVLVRASTAIGDRWRSGQEKGGGVFECFVSVMNELADNPSHAGTHNQAWEVDSIRDRVVGLQRSMKSAVETSLDQHVVPEIEAITVWHVLRRALQDGGDVETRLRKRFETFGKSCALFTKLNGNVTGDGALRQVLNRSLKFFYSEEQAASDCLRPLGLEGDSLTRFLRGPEGIDPEPVNTPDFSDMVILYSEVGHDPRHFEGFDLILEDLLQEDPVVDRGDEKRWSDRRFPEWITEWAKMPR